MVKKNDHITSEQEWSVRFTAQGKQRFLSLGGSPQLSDWSFYVSVPEREGRTEKELVNEIRALSVKKIYEECQKDGLELSLEDVKSLKSYENLESSKQW